MAEANIDGGLGSALTRLLLTDDIQPGDAASYETCKIIWTSHPLGGKMVDAPIKQAQAQAREIAVPNSPEDRVVKAFVEEWDGLRCDEYIAQTAGTARAYGVASIVYGARGRSTNSIIDPWKIPELDLYFNVLDPLNTAGSLVLNQDPNAPDFQKPTIITTMGHTYHRSRSTVIMNERPVYLAYTNSAFGYVGRSVYQRALYPLKSFIQTMITDDMVATKAGLLVVKMKQAGSITNRFMAGISALKREMLKGGRTGNVLNIGSDDNIETLNMINLDGAAGFARTNILKNIATAADMPAVMLENETLTEGFGEGTEDAKLIAGYVDGVRKWMKPLYDFMDPIVMHRAWSPAFYETIRAEYPAEYGKMDYQAAFRQWEASFTASWPNLLKEKDSELVLVDEIRLKAIVSMLQTLAPELDPENRGALLTWAMDNLNELKLMFPDPLDLDIEAAIAWLDEKGNREAEQAQLAGQGVKTSPLKLAGGGLGNR